mgnify:CR=1 FL=1
MDLIVKNLFVCALLIMFLSGCGDNNVEPEPDPGGTEDKQTETPADVDSEDGSSEEVPTEVSEEPVKDPEEEVSPQPETSSKEDNEESTDETIVEDEEPLPDAVQGLKERADQGEALAQFKLASLYESGRDGVPKNLPKAAALYLKAAEQGRADAQYNLAMMYESGHGVAKDAAEAARWFKTFNENEKTK